MAVSKTMRFAILKRDGFTCRYCKSKDAELTVDHVLPVSLGGTDEPENLIAACEPCNQGKGSTPLDAENVADIDQDAIKWAAAMKKSQDSKEQETEARNEVIGGIYQLWMDVTPSYAKSDILPRDWAETISYFMRAGMTEYLLHEATHIAWGREGVPVRSRFKYFCGVARNMIRELEEDARSILEEGDNGGT